ncbi:unnamed protein product, partial [Meganyctiphanes norvegica]
QERLHLKDPFLPPLRDLQGATLTAAIMSGWGHLERDYKHNSGQILGGRQGRLWGRIADSIKVDLKVLRAPTTLSKAENGSWGGPIGFMERWEADIAVGAYSLLPERTEGMDFTNYIAVTGVPFLTKLPTPIKSA